MGNMIEKNLLKKKRFLPFKRHLLSKWGGGKYAGGSRPSSLDCLEEFGCENYISYRSKAATPETCMISVTLEPYLI